MSGFINVQLEHFELRWTQTKRIKT